MVKGNVFHHKTIDFIGLKSGYVKDIYPWAFVPTIGDMRRNRIVLMY